jgi:hypothetical protein
MKELLDGIVQLVFSKFSLSGLVDGCLTLTETPELMPDNPYGTVSVLPLIASGTFLMKIRGLIYNSI